MIEVFQSSFECPSERVSGGFIYACSDRAAKSQGIDHDEYRYSDGLSPVILLREC